MLLRRFVSVLVARLTLFWFCFLSFGGLSARDDDTDSKLSEEYCTNLADKAKAAGDVPDACMIYASVKAKLDSKATDPYAGMSAGSRTNVRNAQIKRRMSTRHGQGPQGKKTSWF